MGVRVPPSARTSTTLRDEPGIGPIATATLLVEAGDPFRFAPSPSSPVGPAPAPWRCPPARETARHRLDFRGNRRINSVLYIASVTQQRDHEPARAYIARKAAEGKTAREARRAHKRHLANRIIRRMWAGERRRATAHAIAA